MSPRPLASRPHMPGYGILAADQGTGLLPWSWAEERLARSHDYWVATIRPDGRPQLTPVWGVWDAGSLWFSCSPGSAKARHLGRDPRCTVATDDPHHPVVIEGGAARVADTGPVERFAAQADAKYATGYGAAFFLANATFCVRPEWAFALTDDDFAGSPTRWHLDPPPRS